MNWIRWFSVFLQDENENDTEHKENDDTKNEPRIKEIDASFLETMKHIASVQEAMANEFTGSVTDITKLNGLISAESRTMDAYYISFKRKDQLFYGLYCPSLIVAFQIFDFSKSLFKSQISVIFWYTR